MRTVPCICLSTLLLLTPALADPTRANTNSPPFSYHSSGSCLAAPEGFDAKQQPINPGFAWSMNFTSAGSVDDHGAGTETGQALDTASFGAGPRMHTPAAHAYSAVFTAVVGEPADDGSVTLHVGPFSGSFSAGPYAGQSFSLSGFDLKKAGRDNSVDVYGTAPVRQTLSLGSGRKFEQLCILTVSTSRDRPERAADAQ